MNKLRSYLAIATLAAACGSGDQESTFGDTPGVSGSTGGTPLIVSDAEASGDAPADGSLPGDECPAAAPTNGSACTTALVCTYATCPTTTTATCDGKAWALKTAPCASFACGSKTCNAGADAGAVGEICVTIQYGTTTGVGCYANPCGTGPLTCRCILATPTIPCAAGCAEVVGREVHCGK